MKGQLHCFKSYDVRGILGKEINEEVFYRIARAFASTLDSKRVVVGHDARASSPSLANSVVNGLLDHGADVLHVGLVCTEEVYWATSEFEACGGICITASHNPIEYNGLKFVKSGSQPLNSDVEFKEIKTIAEKQNFNKTEFRGKLFNIHEEARQKYIEKIISFIPDNWSKPLKVVVNSGNGVAGPTIDRIYREINKRSDVLKVIHVFRDPDPSFPNGIANPMLPENRMVTSEKVNAEEADLGVAFDGDADRCFFFDEDGEYINSEYLVGFFAENFLSKKQNSTIVYEPRVIWNTQDVIETSGGHGVISKVGHAFMKQKMRAHQAIYGGEVSAHHYFKDFAYCDSGMIPMLLVIDYMQKSKKKLSSIFAKRKILFPSSGEINISSDNHPGCIQKVMEFYRNEAVDIDNIDGLSVAMQGWRLNIRSSSTEPLLRLNIESKSDKQLIKEKIIEIQELLEGY
ncbi:MAG: phosphomannomutase [Candidatus Endolissoclinum sp. TMED37]|nr:MAG: phosphomannomutase [Candidatus Endolissoclinum sp. TMED37]